MHRLVLTPRLWGDEKVCNKCLQKALISIECASTSERPSELIFKKLIKQCVWVLELEVDKIFRQAYLYKFI